MAAGDTADLLHAFKELCDAQGGYREAGDFYRGDVGEVFASMRIRMLLQRAGVYNIHDFNYAKIPVDVITEKLQIQAVDAAPPGGDGTAAGGVPSQTGTTDPVEEAVKRLRERNQLNVEEDGLHRNASRDGDAYLFVWPVLDETDRIVDVDMRVNNASAVRVIYSTEDPLVMQYAIKSWEAVDPASGKPIIRVNLYYADRIERWATIPGQKGHEARDWRPFEDQDAAGEPRDAILPNPYGVVPFFHFRNDRPYGVPEHKSAYGPQEMINKLIISHAATIDYMSFPQRYTLVDPTADDPMRNLVDSLHPEDDDDDPEDGLNESQYEADPSAVWRMYASRGVGQFEPANPHNFLDPLDRYIQAMAELTGVSKSAFTKSTADVPSGVAFRELKSSETARGENRQMVYGAVWGDAYGFALALLGYPDHVVTVKWKPIQQVTDTEGWQVVQQKIENGVPVREALIETGYASDEVDEWMAGGADLARRISLLSQIAGAASSLGAAVTLGVLSQEQVNALIGQLFGEVNAASINDLSQPMAPPGAVPPPPPPPVPAAGQQAQPAMAGA